MKYQVYWGQRARPDFPIRKSLARTAGPLGIGIIMVMTLASVPAFAQNYTVLHSFQCPPGDGALPLSGLIRDGAGNLYGTTEGGGTYNFGTIFELTPAGAETVLHSFAGSPNDGEDPVYGSLVRDSAGDLYGTTAGGGSRDGGTAFKLAPDGTETIIHSFGALNGDGQFPYGDLTRDVNDHLYGTTYAGGLGFGTVFELFPGGIEYHVYSFQGFNEGDGANPESSLVSDSKGYLYGTTRFGGTFGTGGGTVFKVSPIAGETAVLHSFGGAQDGLNPIGGLVEGSAGLFYGTTAYGGASGNGTVFAVNSVGKEQVLYSFAGGPDGGTPIAGLARDKKGNLYGGTYYGGSTNCFDGLMYGCGVLFKVTPSGKEIVLYSFTGSPDGANPSGPLLLSGNSLYGVTFNGGAYGCGTVFKFTP